VESLVQLPPGLLTGATTVAPGQLIVGVDGGGTKTLAAAWDPATGEVWLGKAGPSNLDAIAEGVAAQSLESAVDAATDAAGRSSDDVAVAVFGLAGTDTSKVAHLVDERFEYATTFTVNDSVTAWAAGTECKPGVAVIAGTGSNILGVGRHEEIWRAGGWGHIIGDEGSGYWFGLEGIRAGLAHRDATGPPTRLAEAAARHFGAKSVEDVANLVYQRPLTKAEVASFSVVVAELGHGGDATAGRILREGGHLLAHQALTVIRRTGLAGHEPFMVAQVGSTWNAGPLFRGTFESLVQEGASGVTFAHVHAPPVYGALLLAGRAARVWADEPPAGLDERLEQALKAG
jgi:glucosamine kinase